MPKMTPKMRVVSWVLCNVTKKYHLLVYSSICVNEIGEICNKTCFKNQHYLEQPEDFLKFLSPPSASTSFHRVPCPFAVTSPSSSLYT